MTVIVERTTPASRAGAVVAVLLIAALISLVEPSDDTSAAHRPSLVDSIGPSGAVSAT